MTAICGIVSLDGAAVPHDHFERMMTALAHHGLACVHGFRVNCAEDTALEPRSGSDSSLSPPYDRGGNHLLIALNARLDNRKDLVQRLGIQQPTHFADSHLILAAYEKWGERCVEFLLGDFAFAIWDQRQRKLFCSRDHMGQCPLFYYHDARRFIFASEPKALVTVPGVTNRVNRNKLASLAFPSARPLFWDQSWFEDITALPAGTSLTLDEHGLHTRRYWEPTPETGLSSRRDDEILEAFQSLMFDVVGDRLDGSTPTVALLSGGLDSSSVVSVASRILERRNEELHTLSVVLPTADKSSLTDERSFIDQFRAWPNVRINYVTAPQRGPFDNLEQLVWSCDTPILTSRHYLYSVFAETASDLGARVILDGSGGELGPTFHGDGYYAELLLRLRWPTLWRELRLRRQIKGDSLWRAVRSDVINPLLPATLLDKLRPKIAEDVRFEQQQPLQLEFAENQLAGMLPRVKASSRSFLHVLPKHDRMQVRTLLRVQQKGTRVGGFVGHGQVELRYPFMDKRLLEFCLAVPGTLKIRNGYNRYLIRAGLDKLLPAAIQWRTSKQPFSPDYLRRYNAQRAQAQTLLNEIRVNDPVREIVDVEKLRVMAAVSVADDERGTFAESTARDAVPAGIYLIYFLRRFAEFQN